MQEDKERRERGRSDEIVDDEEEDLFCAMLPMSTALERAPFTQASMAGSRMSPLQNSSSRSSELMSVSGAESG